MLSLFSSPQPSIPLHRAGVWILGLLVGLLLAEPGPVAAQVDDPARSDVTVVSPVDAAQRLAEDRRALEADLDAGRPIRPRRIGVTRTVNVSPQKWTVAAGNAVQWRHAFVAPGAKGISLLFDRFNLPPGASVRIFSPDGRWTHGPYTAGDASGGIHATPIVWSDTLIVTVAAPSDREHEVDLRVRDVIPAYVDLGDALHRSDIAAAKSGACNVDVACPDADPYRDEVRSVALYTYVRSGSQRVCTGSLVNNTAEDGRPFFLTAEHCMSSESVVNTSVYYWNFQNSTCRSPGSSASGSDSDDDPLEQTSSGAFLRARNGNFGAIGTISGKPDLLLVELDDASELQTFDVYFNGWDVSGTTPTQTVGIHHPGGDAKRISIDADAPLRTSYVGDTPESGSTHWRIGAWDTGTTERGSSGSPLYDTNNRVIGVLSGGFAACASSGSENDNDRPDWYGALADGFEETDYGTTTFREWLDPLGTGTATLDGADLPVLPVELAGLSASGAEGSITVRWETLSETDNAGFRLILTRDGEAPRRIGQEFASRGTASSGATYRYTAQNLSAGPYTVNLLQVDLDGGERIVGTTTAVVNLSGPVEVEPVAPHPVRSESHAVVTVREAQNLQITLYDLLGRPVQRFHDGPVNALDPIRLTLRRGTLSAGSYFLRITGDTFARTERVVVMR